MAVEALGCSHLWKRFGEFCANADVSLSVERGALHAVIGENGAGKSTLMRGLYGIDPPDEGEVRFGGEVVTASVQNAIARGVGMVHQHFMLVPTLTVAENVMLGRESCQRLLLDERRVERELGEVAARYRLAVEPQRLVRDLSVGEAQRVEILKVLWRGADVLILDEPTAVLTPLEVVELGRTLRELCASGKTVVLVTHKLDEVMTLCDRVTVLRRGEVVGDHRVADTNPQKLALAMVGREVDLERRPLPMRQPSRPRLSVAGFSVERSDGTAALVDVSFDVEAGEMLGVAGVEGNGQSELVLALAGLHSQSGGRVSVDGEDLTAYSPRRRQRSGLRWILEDRQQRGLALDFSVEENVLLGHEEKYSRAGWVERAKLRRNAKQVIEAMQINPPDIDRPARALSGGNQQKIVVGRELGSALKVLLCAQPTRGVDVGAAARIHAALLAERARGTSVLLLSADLDELLSLCDRIAVLFRGRMVGTIVNDFARAAEVRQTLAHWMLGVLRQAQDERL